MASFENKSDQESFVDQVKKGGIVNRRRDFYGNERNVVSYYLSHSQGIGILYVNEETRSYFQEEVGFDLENCMIEGDNDNRLEVLLKPKSEKLIKIVPIDAKKPFKAAVKSIMSWFS